VSVTLTISEIFSSIQGEGLLTGMPSVFVRTSGCNLRCSWCDTPYTSWTPEGEAMSLADILRAVDAHPSVGHVVLTGGEPMIAKGASILVSALQKKGYHVTVETAGTVWQEMSPDLWSISPKLANSTPPEEPWRTRHDGRRLAEDVIAQMMASAPYQLKFVVAEPADLDELAPLVARLGAEASRVLLMPEGRDVARLDAVASWLVKACMERGFRFCDRMHVRLFGDTRGT